MGKYRAIEFQSEGATLRGRLYPPAGGSTPCALVIMAHGFTATITMTLDRYAEVFAEHGLGVLLYDHYSLGSSDGEPRRTVDPWVQMRGYRDAVKFAARMPDIDERRIGLWGDSFSGMEVIILAALLEGIAVASVMTPSCGDQPPPSDADGKIFGAMRDYFQCGRGRSAGDVIGPLPVVSWDFARHPAHLEPLSAFRWFMEHGGRLGSGWANDATRIVPGNLSAGVAARHVRVPIQVVYAPDDEMRRAAPGVNRLVCEALPDPKEVFVLPEGCGHFGHLWHPSPWFDLVSTKQAAFFLRYLGR